MVPATTTSHLHHRPNWSPGFCSCTLCWPFACLSPDPFPSLPQCSTFQGAVLPRLLCQLVFGYIQVIEASSRSLEGGGREEAQVFSLSCSAWGSGSTSVEDSLSFRQPPLWLGACRETLASTQWNTVSFHYPFGPRVVAASRCC